MSTAVVSTSAAQGRPFVFDEEAETHVVERSLTAVHTAHPQPGVAPHDSRGRLSLQELQSTINNQKIPPSSITPASQLAIRPAPEMAPSGIPALDALTGGLPRGCLTEICGSASSGRTTILLAALAAATRRGEYCAVIDACDSLDPHSVAAAGIDLDRLLWVRCGDDFLQKKFSPQRRPSTPLRAGSGTEKSKNKKEGCPTLVPQFLRDRACPEQAKRVEGVGSQRSEMHPEKHEHRLEQLLRATDLLLESGGFGLIVLDLADVPPQAARHIPLTTWFRFRRAVEHKPTILLAIEQHPIAGSCSSLLLQLGTPSTQSQSIYDLAAKRRKDTAHGVSRGWNAEDSTAPEGRKKICIPRETSSDTERPSHAHLLTELQIHAELIHSRLERKPARSITFATKTAWAG